jgi:N-acetylmuramoyl-L-alanine amidase
LEESGDVRAFLTRRGDYFVSLEDRVKVAQEYGADLFISLHANASRKREARGSSVYCLSLKGASDKATELLAQKENASDMVGGISMPPRERDLDSILLDLEQTHTINESLHLGGLALSELSRINSIQFTQPREAGFRVLQAPSIPSILVEAAYITNPVEERFLRQERFQLKLIQAIVTAVKKFMPLLAVKEESGGLEPVRGKGQKRGG